LVSFLFDGFLFLVAFRVLMVWVYDRTGSLLLAMLMHASLVFTVNVINPFDPLKMAGVPLLTFDLLWAAALCIVIGAIALVNRGHLSRHPPLRRQAS
jgi:uncharacterized protein